MKPYLFVTIHIFIVLRFQQILKRYIFGIALFNNIVFVDRFFLADSFSKVAKNLEKFYELIFLISLNICIISMYHCNDAKLTPQRSEIECDGHYVKCSFLTLFLIKGNQLEPINQW